MIQPVSQPLQQPEVDLGGLEELGDFTLERDVGGGTVKGGKDPLDGHEDGDHDPLYSDGERRT